MPAARRVLIAGDPFQRRESGDDMNRRGKWPCRWIGCASAGPAPYVAAFRRRFTLQAGAVVRVHVTADERYELFLDGKSVGRGSERGDAANWFFETYDMRLKTGTHTIVARTWTLGDKSPFAQMSVKPGFLLAPEDDKYLKLLGTGVAPWEAKKLDGYTFIDPGMAWGTGLNVDIDGARYPWGFESGTGGGWKPADVLHQAGFAAAGWGELTAGQLLKPATLPPMMDELRRTGTVRHVAAAASSAGSIAVRARDHLAREAGGWTKLLSGAAALTMPAKTCRRVIVDLGNYYCAYPELVTTGGKGASVRIHWAESLYEKADGQGKGNRDEVEGKYFHGVGDVFRPDGGRERKFTTLWWQAGRYVEFLVRTASEPLVLGSFALRETRYPLEMESSFEASDPRFAGMISIAVRGLQMCSHETYMDCPYYEQLMYVGDTRLEAKTTYIISRDDRLPRKALRMFDASRFPSGLTQSRYPCRVPQVIPPFSLWWVGMVFDFALWRGDREFVKTLMPGVRAVLDAFRSCLNADGLVETPPGWNYMDWVPAWKDGIPPDGARGVSGLINWQFVQCLMRASELEQWMGEPELASRNLRLASDMATRLTAVFWDKGRSLFADDIARRHFSEHSQCLAVMSGQVETDRRARIARALVEDPGLYRATIYFSYYLFEAYRLLGRMDALFDRLGLWFDLKTRGLKTTIEMPEPTRSDCHGWGSHPVYHCFATILGIRPAGIGVNEIFVEPALGPLAWARGKLVHPSGTIEVDFRKDGGGLRGTVTLPPGLSGTIMQAGASQPLKSGRQKVALG